MFLIKLYILDIFSEIRSSLNRVVKFLRRNRVSFQRRKMFKQEDYNILSGEYSPPNPNIQMDNHFILTDSPPFDIDINEMTIIPIMHEDISLSHGNMLELTPQFEETMDVATKFEQREFPMCPRGPPERKDFAGDLDFQVEINAQDTHKKKYLYSNILNRIYVDMKIDFPVVFSWKKGFGPSPAYVRACVVFSDESQAEKRVERCTQHTHDASNADISQEIVKNVLHSSREIGTHGVYYSGRPELADSWYSVLVEVGPNGGSHAFQFVCKNSCSSGINRRAIDVIFTFEDANGTVYGRQTVGARVCSCPRRDLQRDEKEEAKGKPGKRRMNPNPPAPCQEQRSKKIKLEIVGVDDSVMTLPPLQIVGARAMVAGLQVMLSMMEAAAEMRRNDPNTNDRYSRRIAELRDKIEDLKKTQH